MCESTGVYVHMSVCVPKLKCVNVIYTDFNKIWEYNLNGGEGKY